MLKSLAAIWLIATSAVADDTPWTWDCEEVIHSEANESLTDYRVKKDRAFKITFSKVSEEEWMMTGNAGSVSVVAVSGPGVIHFLESTPFGTINLTQISTSENGGIYKAVHSRHTVLVSQMAPSQYLLSCRTR
jgi:hypothetical protein